MTQVTNKHEQKHQVIHNVAIEEHLTEEQRSALLKVLSEESKAFSSDDNDDGDIKGFQLGIEII